MKKFRLGQKKTVVEKRQNLARHRTAGSNILKRSGKIAALLAHTTAAALMKNAAVVIAVRK